MPALSRRIHDLPSRARLLHFPLSTTFFPSHRTNRRCSPDIRVSKLISLRKLERILKDKLVLPTFTPNPQAQQQQQTEKQAEQQSPAPGTPFRRLGPLARGTQLSQLGGSSPILRARIFHACKFVIHIIIHHIINCFCYIFIIQSLFANIVDNLTLLIHNIIIL